MGICNGIFVPLRTLTKPLAILHCTLGAPTPPPNLEQARFSGMMPHGGRPVSRLSDLNQQILDMENERPG